MSEIRAVRGMVDLFENELILWRYLEQACHRIFPLYGFQEIRTPIMEELELFVRSVGEGTDIVDKEMFIFSEQEKHYCLRPENTASVVRALLQKGALGPDFESKYFYLGPMFRKERPQRGRLRQFHQFGVEAFGVSAPFSDVEVILMLCHLLSDLGLRDFRVALNSSGTPEERAQYVKKLADYFRPLIGFMCDDCKRRLEKNTLRILDCKQERCQPYKEKAPRFLENLGAQSRQHFEAVCQGLNKAQIDYYLEPFLVRGLDYYCQTVFEVVATSGLGSQNAIAGGGRYDGLVSLLGGKNPIPAVGFAAGMDRIILLLEEQQKKDVPKNAVNLSLIYADDEGYSWAEEAVFALRKMGISVDFCAKKRSVKAQMRRADHVMTQYALVVGSMELQKKQALLKGLRDHSQREIDLNVESIRTGLEMGATDRRLTKE